MNKPRISGWMILLITVLTGLIATLFWHLSRTPATAATSLIIILLTALNGLLMLTLLFVIVKSLIRIYIDRKNKARGIRIKTKLVLAVLPISLIPAGMMYFFSTQILSRTLQKLSIDANIARVIEEAYSMNEVYAKRMHQVFKPVAEAAFQSDQIQKLLADYQLCSAEFYSNETIQHAVYVSSLQPDQIRRLEKTRHWNNKPGNDLYDDGFSIWRFPYQTPKGDLMLGMIMNTSFSERWAFISDSYKYLNHAKRKRDLVSDTFKTSLLVITFAVAFAGIWLGNLFSKSLMRSLTTLIEGTDRVARGEFEGKISLQTGDELEDLGKAFNSMVEQLKENQWELQSRAEDLEEVNTRLQQQYDYTETLLNQINAGILAFFENGIVQTCNPAAERMLGFRPSDIEKVGGQSHLTPLYQSWKKFQLHGRRPVTEQLEWNMDEQTLNVAVTFAPVQSKGKVMGTLLVLEDLTSLLNAQKLAAWREVARRVAHEIKNPLTPLQLSIQRIYRKSENDAVDLKQVIRSGYETISSEIKLLEQLVNEFSHYAKLPAPSKHAFDLVELLKNSQETYQQVYQTMEIQLETPLAELTIHGDSSQVRQVIGNLVKNAVSASSEKGIIVISLKVRESLAFLKVSDQGKGISEDEKKKIFIPYYSKTPKGTGLGLAIVQRIIHDHGWHIRVKNNHPKGTVFTIQMTV